MPFTPMMSPRDPLPAPPATSELLSRYRAVRAATLAGVEPLEVEDLAVQSMPDASPAKWHLAHTTWFFETFVLGRSAAYRPVHEAYAVLFNSYYESVGPQHARPERGLLTRPTVKEVFAYRARVDEKMEERLSADVDDALAAIVELGLHHEQQHQELLLTDIKHLFSKNPLRPAYAPRIDDDDARPPPLRFSEHAGGLVEIGHDGSGFAFDNESPRHRVYLEPFAIASRLVTAGEYLAFMRDGGYERPELWLSDGWHTVQREGWRAPLYWEPAEDGWLVFTLAGMKPVDESAPVCHVSLYEADAYARWAGARLPSEAEWEIVAAEVARTRGLSGNFVERGHLHPVAADDEAGIQQLFGDVWEWTRSAYAAYPGYRPAAGALGEYNGKFMSGQVVLRGGSCVTPGSHIRTTYRNFFPPAARWQLSGIRLARDA